MRFGSRARHVQKNRKGRSAAGGRILVLLSLLLVLGVFGLSGCTENPPTLPETTEGLAESTAVKVEVTEEASLPQNVQVPLLIGDSVEEAVRKLTEAGLAEPMIRREYDEAEKGRVTGQNTEAGSLLARGSVITLTVSRGPEPFELPDLVGWEAAAAKALLDSRGITVSFEYVIQKDVAEDLILEQDLVPKTILYKGDCIRLTVSEKEPLRNVADVTGLSRNEAEEKLRAQGFTVLVREDYDSRIPSGRVISQDPAAGMPQDAGVRISLLVSKGPRPTQPLPTNPPPTQPAPTQPIQTDPAPTQPEPTQPAPTQPEPTQPAPTETVPESTEKAYITYRFRSSRLLNEHYQKHGIEMGFSSASAYEKAASDVINNPDALCKREKEDNDFVFYVVATNEFVVLSTDGYIRTYFLPNAGKAYFDRQ